MLKDKTLTYISLFSCAGVGCFGFKKAGFECIATNELIERRINVQKFNDKCKFDSGYICDNWMYSARWFGKGNRRCYI